MFHTVAVCLITNCTLSFLTGEVSYDIARFDSRRYNYILLIIINTFHVFFYTLIILINTGHKQYVICGFIYIYIKTMIIMSAAVPALFTRNMYVLTNYFCTFSSYLGMFEAWKVLSQEHFIFGTFCRWDVLSLGPFESWDVLYLGHFVVEMF